MLTKDHIQQFPKIELHCHLDGSIRPQTLINIANQQGLPIAQDLAEVSRNMRAPERCDHLVDYLRCFDFVRPYLQSEEALSMAAYDVMEQAAEDGVAYIEIRFAPSLSMDEGLTCIQTIKAVAKGIAQAEETFPIKGNILVIGMRQEALTDISTIFKEALAADEPKVVGIDLAGPEDDGYVPSLAESYQVLIDQQQIQLTLHAGECGCVQNVYQAIESGAQRIGHGIAMKDDFVAQAFVRQHDRLVEGCPTSNLHTKMIESYADYPLRQWIESKMPFCLNTDNRTVSNTTLTNEYWQMVQHCDLTIHEMQDMLTLAVQHSFAAEEDKEALLRQIKCTVHSETIK